MAKDLDRDFFQKECAKLQDKHELQLYMKAQYTALSNAAMRIQQLESEVLHLKQLLMNATMPKPEEKKVERIIVSTEQLICEMQLKRLEEKALTTELTLEETKRLDLFVKNLYLAKGQSTAIVAGPKPRQYSEAELVTLASIPTHGTEEG